MLYILAIDDEYRIQTSPYEFCLVSPSDGMTRVERVKPNDIPRLQLLYNLTNNPANLQAKYVAEQQELVNNLIKQNMQQQLLQQQQQQMLQSTTNQVCITQI